MSIRFLRKLRYRSFYKIRKQNELYDSLKHSSAGCSVVISLDSYEKFFIRIFIRFSGRMIYRSLHTIRTQDALDDSLQDS